MTYTIADKELLLDELESQKLKSKKCDEDNYHKDYYSNPYDREIQRIGCLLTLLEYDIVVSDYGDGTVIVNDKFILSLRNLRWRVEGRSKWYYASSIDSFVNKYVLGNR